MVTRQRTVTLQDVADLARVRRPVVSMWRRRGTVPFPEPVGVTDGVQRFDLDEVVGYLRTTRRGRNAEADQDAPAVGVPDGVDPDDVVTLLCLHVLTGEELAGRTGPELAALAAAADPDDRLLRREVRDRAFAPSAPEYVDDLVEASYGPADALRRVEHGRLGRGAAGPPVSDGLVELLRAVTGAARQYLGDLGDPGEPGDPAGAGAVALAPPADPRLTPRLADGFAGVVLGDDDADRPRRRRCVVDGVDVLDRAAAVVRVLSVVGTDDDEALEAVDVLALSLGRTDVGVVVGPASLLCDRLAGDAAHRRAQTLRPGNLALAARLPRGLRKEAHRQNLALWVLRGAPGAPGDSGTGSGTGGGTAPVCLVDLASERIVLDDLASDVLAALQGSDGRAYRYARRTGLAAVLAGASVVPPGVRAVRLGRADAGYVDRIHAATLTTGRPPSGFDVTVAPAPARLVLRRRSLGELVESRALVVRRGSRIDRAHAVPDGTVRVLSADGSTDDLRLDPFDAVRLYPRATRTEPGDVLVVDRPAPVARVDPDGGALVASPSRILRPAPDAPIGPYALAAIVNEIVDGGEWRTWSVPELPHDESSALERVLAAAAAHRAELRRHERALHDAVTNLVQGVAAGAVTLDPTVTTMGAG